MNFPRFYTFYTQAIAALILTVLIAAACGSSTPLQSSQTDPLQANASEAATNSEPVVAPELIPEQMPEPTFGETASATPTERAPKQPTPEPSNPCDTIEGPAILNTVPTPSLTVDGQTTPLVDFTGERFDFGYGEQDAAVLLTDNGSSIKIPIDLESQTPTGEDFIITVNNEQLTGPGSSLQFSNDSCLAFAGNAVGPDGTVANVKFMFEIGTGHSYFTLDGNRAIVNGLLGRHTFRQMQYLIAQHPNVHTLVLQNIDGSDEDRINVETGRLVREAELATVVPANGEIYSGGVDLFAAGVTRTIEPGGIVGVHAWCCTPDGSTADELDINDPAHNHLITYLQEMLGADLGRDFYFFTVQSAPANDIHEMTNSELAKYLITE